MSYKIPDFSNPLEKKETQRLKQYAINACTFITTKFLYSKQQSYDFLTFKKRIPPVISIYKNTIEEDNEIKYSQREIIDYPIIDIIMQELEEKNIFNDEEYAIRKAESYMNRKKGITFIRRELQSKKFSPDIIDKTINQLLEENEETYDDVFRSAADSLTRKTSFMKKEPYQRKQFFLTTLMRRGYDMSDIIELTTDDNYAHYFIED